MIEKREVMGVHVSHMVSHFANPLELRKKESEMFPFLKKSYQDCSGSFPSIATLAFNILKCTKKGINTSNIVDGTLQKKSDSFTKVSRYVRMTFRAT